jgi:hypothetical protein
LFCMEKRERCKECVCVRERERRDETSWYKLIASLRNDGRRHTLIYSSLYPRFHFISFHFISFHFISFHFISFRNETKRNETNHTRTSTNYHRILLTMSNYMITYSN